MNWARFAWSLSFLLSLCCGVAGQASVAPGYTLHFQFIRSEREGRESVALAAAAGAKAISLVPPAHCWENRISARTLDAMIDEAKRRHLRLLFSRIDAAFPDGTTWLFDRALGEVACLPGGQPTDELFRSTVGNHPFERWQNDETSYLARRYGRVPGLMATTIGGMVEPFVSQRGSLAAWSERTQCYELAQYTPAGLAEWHHWLGNSFGGISAINSEYHARFASLDAVPMPENGADKRFGRPRAAYFDLVRCCNDWFQRQYRENRALWRRDARAPFLLQFSGGAAEKIALGRPEFAAFDLPAWIEEADAVGLSLYTNVGYPDWGHANNWATIQMLSAALDLGKPTVIMESGCEAPRVTTVPHELSYATRLGMLLQPSAYIYEYFRYSREGRVDSGMMVTPEGARHQPGFDTVSAAMRGLTQMRPVPPSPCYYYLSAPLCARTSELAGRVNRAVYFLAMSLPCRMLPWRSFARIPAGQTVLLPPALEQVVPRAELAALVRMARARRWQLAGTRETCERIGDLRLPIGDRGGPGQSPIKNQESKIAWCPLALERMLACPYPGDEADDLLEALETVPAFRSRLEGQPVAPRPGVTWLQSGGDLYVWVEDGDPVELRAAGARRLRITRVWCSTRSGKPVEVRWVSAPGTGARRQVPCREWYPLTQFARSIQEQ